jgi:AcrR family transcriptional regulator
MPAPIISKEEVLDRLTVAFRRHGYDGASIARLSEATGLGKASLYHYFPGGKTEMAAAVLGHLGEQFEALILAPLRSSAAPEERLNRMILGLSEFYDRGRQACVLDLFAIGGLRESLGPALAGAIEGWTDILAGVLEDAGVPAERARERAEDAVIAVEGALVVSRARDAVDPFQRTLAELPQRLLAAA